MDIQITPINKKYTSIANRFVRADAIHAQIVNDEDLCETESGRRKNERAQEKSYNKAAELWAQLPKREQNNIKKHIDCTGYPQ